MAETSAGRDTKSAPGRSSLDIRNFQEKHGMNKPRKMSLKSIAWRAAAALGIGTAGLAIDHGTEPANTVVQGVTTGAENAADAVVRRVEDIQHKGEQVVDINSGLYNKFLTRQEDGTLIISETRQVVEVKYTPHADSTSQYWNGNNIVIHRKPEADFGEGQDIPVDEIKATYAIRVTGGAFGGQTNVGRFQVKYQGKEYTVGEWFQLSDEQGNPVSLKGEPLQKGENPYYIAGSFASVITPSAAQAPSE